MTKGRKQRSGKNSRPSQKGARLQEQKPLVHDPSLLWVTRDFDTVKASERRVVWREIPKHLPLGYKDGQVIDPVETGAYFAAVASSLEAEAYELVQVYSSVQWLWYLRRVPRETFAGRLRTTAANDHALIEALSGVSVGSGDKPVPAPDGSDAITYPVSLHALRPVARLAALAVVLANCHVGLRRAAKGASYRVHIDKFPERVPEPGLDEAIERFDQRVALSPGFSWSQGLTSGVDHPDPDHWPLLVVHGVPGRWPEVPGWLGKLSEQRFARVKGQHHIDAMSIADLAQTIEGLGSTATQWWDPALPSLVVLLQVLFHTATYDSKSMGISMPKVGYMSTSRNWLARAVDTGLPELRPLLSRLFPGTIPVNGEKVLHDLDLLTPHFRPLQPGPILRTARSQTLIDVHAASQRLYQMVVIPRQTGGVLVNAVAKRFEHIVQEAIDTSDWRPQPKLREIRGRTLKIGRRAVTDIDAIGQKGSTLLVVSCKNIPYTDTYDAGDHKQVRNVEETLDKAVQRWDEIIGILKSTPEGANYNVSEFDQFIGVVVTPHVMFSRASAPNSSVRPGLPKACSVSELTTFLESTTSQS